MEISFETDDIFIKDINHEKLTEISFPHYASRFRDDFLTLIIIFLMTIV